MKISDYVSICKLLLIKWEENINNNGITETFSGEYSSIDELRKDSVSQLKTHINDSCFDMDITLEEAIKYLLK